VLGTFALAVGAALLLVNRITADTVEANKLRALRQTLQIVLPGDTHNNDPAESKLTLEDEHNNQRIAYRAFRDGQPVAAAITASAPDGYAGQIELLVGVSYAGVITGVRVLSHQETPGLGDLIDAKKSSWIIEFNGESLSQTRIWKVRKDGGDFDQFTGATITPRAVVRAVKQTLEWYMANRQRIFEPS
jgi:electron transport complex protein RnfG